MQDKAEFREFI